ncbi:hypothetical protein CAPTEDRAFT_210399 [Capitella teleta]|uniref:Glycosyltransferase family 92 protein n=1 Tax=Capitella teleta TaxID=283909 RepID=N1PB24_CAPTE|nr:hypothetical protein CAPTEDRAFT_210399 [Capitella teleta]|eukprot:ELU18918.1 hypothetical protein CAPTEDRAFT_210399 [Capitella teleta]
MKFRVRVKDIQWGALALFVVYSLIVVCFLFNEMERHAEEQHNTHNRVKMVWDARRRQEYYLSHDSQGNEWFKEAAMQQAPPWVNKGTPDQGVRPSMPPAPVKQYGLAAYTATQMEYADPVIQNFRRDIAGLKQWIHYLIITGVEHIFICDCHEDEKHHLTHALANFTQQGIVTHLAVHINISRGFVLQNAQAECFQRLLPTIKSSAHWLMNINMYEYPFVRNDFHFGFLNRHLHRLTDQTNYTDINVQYLRIDGPVDISQGIVMDRGRYLQKAHSDEIVAPIYRPASRVQTNNPEHTDEQVGSDEVRPVINAVESEHLVLINYHRAIRPDLQWTKSIEELSEFPNITLSIGPSLRKSLKLFGEPDAYLPT